MAAYEQTLKFLYDLQRSGIKAGLENVRAILGVLDHPHRRYPVIHIAGTNGKGSTASMIAASLTAAGYRTGLYTSPHLIDFRERIRINGREIPESALVDYARTIRPVVEERNATFFDATTAIAFRFFTDRKVDVAVIETGLGGRWDSTNVVYPVLSIITSIGLEHREYLGNTLRKIAFEKSGIIKRGAPVVTGLIAGPARDVILRRARAKGSRVFETGKHTSVEAESVSMERASADMIVADRKITRLGIIPSGFHQITNARTALLALSVARGEPGWFDVPVRAIRQGFSSLHALGGLSGRLQVIRRNPTVVIDAAHNPDGVRSLVRTLAVLGCVKSTVVFGVLEDKDYREMIGPLREVAGKFVFVRPGTARARETGDLVDYARSVGFPAFSGGSVGSGIRLALKENQPERAILITGSHFVAGEAMHFLRVRP